MRERALGAKDKKIAMTSAIFTNVLVEYYQSYSCIKKKPNRARHVQSYTGNIDQQNYRQAEMCSTSVKKIAC